MSVEQAAERLRDVETALKNRRTWKEAWAKNDKAMQLIHPYNRFEGQNEYDAEQIAQQYEMLFDQTPLSEEILRATFTHWSERQRGVCIAGDLWLKVCFGDSWDVKQRIENDMGEVIWDTVAEDYKTVGDLRRLLSALHIDCAVVVPESEASNG